MQRPHLLLQTDFVHGQQHFQPRHQPNLRPGTFHSNHPCILQCHRERSERLCLFQGRLQCILPRSSYAHQSIHLPSRHLHKFTQGRQGRALVYNVQKNGPPSTSFPDQCPPSPIPHPAAWPIRYTSKISDPKNPSSPPVLSSLSFDVLTNAQNGYRMVCNGPEWDPTTTTTAQPADWFPCPSKPSIPGSWSFRVESYTDYQTFNLAIRQWVCSEVQCQTNLAYANLTVATRDERFSICDPWGTCTSESAGKTVDAPIYGVTNLTVIE